MPERTGANRFHRSVVARLQAQWRTSAIAVMLGPVLLTTGLLVASGASAAAGVVIGQPTSFHARFSTRAPGVATGLSLRTAGRVPPGFAVEAAAVRQTIVFPQGTRLRLNALPQCRATDAEITAEGAEGACPVRSRVGRGAAGAFLSGAPVRFTVAIYAVRGHLVFAAEQGGKPLKQAFDGFAEGARLLLTVPTLGGRIAPTSFSATIPVRPGGATWLVTPMVCPASGHWTATGRFQGVSSTRLDARPLTPVQRLVDHLPCRRS